mmetsp:Transcript_33152/g.98674  ORF Transcript_33152/g.98674 Transcript_33152/m.98674 type:complete len:293 (-) Transcript_33152:239-1117(-)
MSQSQALTPEQEQLVEKLKKEVAPLVEQHACLKLFCREHTYVRYMRARSWNLQKATKMLLETLKWRLEYKPHLIRWDDIKGETKSGKHYIYHVKDNFGRPIVMMRPRMEDTKSYDTQTRFLIYDLEQVARMADQSGVGKMTWLLDFEGYSLSNAPPLKVSMYCNHVLQNHYPERLGLAVCYHAPTLFSITWKAVAPFIDPVTKEKIKFVDKGSKEAAQMQEKFDMSEMEKCVGGQRDGLLYDAAKYEEHCRKYDQEIQAELDAIESSMSAAQAKTDGAEAATGAAVKLQASG